MKFTQKVLYLYSTLSQVCLSFFSLQSIFSLHIYNFKSQNQFEEVECRMVIGKIRFIKLDIADFHTKE